MKVLERKLEACTEFPNANPKLTNESESDPLQDSPLGKRVDPRRVPFTPRDQTRLLCLRQDPSVASLLNMYDDKGRIQSAAFSNTPPSSAPVEELPGRQQIKRSGSTLRQLLGKPTSQDGSENAAEGDISWAERYLGYFPFSHLHVALSTDHFTSEHAGSAHSLASTAPVETPKDTHFTDDPSTKPFIPNFTFSSDISHDLSVNYPLISSMEVELSGATEHDVTSPVVEEPEPEAPKTPMRASEVFGFLTERRKSVLERQRSQLDRSYSAPAVPPKDDQTPRRPKTSSPDTSDTSISSSAQIHTATLTKLTPILNPLSRSTDTLNLLYTTQSPLMERPTSPNIPQVNTRRQVTGDSLHTVASSTSSQSSSKIPRGPRPLPSANNTPRAERTLKSSTKPSHTEPTMELPTPAPTPAPRSRIPKHAAPQDPFTPVRPRHHKKRITSQTSSVVSNEDSENSTRIPGRHHRKSSRGEPKNNKENTPPTAAAAAVPLRTIFDMRHPNLVKGEPPSPASSSELSPIAKEMMTNLRKQRMHAREQVRSTGRSSTGRSSRRRS